MTARTPQAAGTHGPHRRQATHEYILTHLAFNAGWPGVFSALPVVMGGIFAMTLCVFALIASEAQLAIALGSTVGGLLFDSSGHQSTFVASAAVLLLAAFLTSRSQAPQAA